MDRGTRPGRAGPGPLRVATIITRLEGGAGLLALRGAKVMDPQAVASTIITGSGDDLVDAARAAGLRVIIEPALRPPLQPRRDLQAVRRLEALLGSEGFDVVHTHTSKAGAVGRLAARRLGVARIVHTYHGFPWHAFQSPPRRAAYVRIERRLGRYTDTALCVGGAVAAEAARRRLIAPERIRAMGVALDDAEAAAAAASSGTPQARLRAREALGLPPEARVVGVVGRLTYQKAPADFLAAMVALGRPDVVGVWIGGGELAGQVGRRAADLTGARVILAGQRADVLDLLPALDVFVLPSLYEGLPTVIVEAMVCGIPVVATAVNAVPDLVVPGVTGLLVPPRQPDLLAAAVRYLLDSPSAAQRMAGAARARLGDQFSEAALRSALMAAYAPAAALVSEWR